MKNSSPQKLSADRLKIRGAVLRFYPNSWSAPYVTVWNELCRGPDISRYEPVFLRKTEVWRGIGFRTRSVYIEYQDPYLNIVVNRVTFLLFSSVSHFKSFRIFVTVPGVVLYSFVTKRATRLCTPSTLNVRVPCTTSILKPSRQFKFLEACQTNVKTMWSIVTSAGIVI